MKVQGGVVQLLEGWRPLTEVERRQAVDARLRRRRCATRSSAQSDGAVPPFFFASPSRPSRRMQRYEAGADPADEAFRAELLAFLDEHAPAEVAARSRLARRRRRRDADGDDDHPAVGARLAGDAVRPRLDDPRLPARARRPQRHARRRRSSTWRSWPSGGIPRSLHFGGYAIVAPSPARVRQRRAARRWRRRRSAATPCGASA